jgi:DNA-binding NarL/FixJ family response regulator
VTIHVVVAETDPLVCEGLAENLRDELHVLAEAVPDAVEALAAARRRKASVLLISDVLFGRLDLDRFPVAVDYGRSVRTLVLGPPDGAQRTAWYLRHGCAGYISRREGLATLRKAVRAVAKGEIWAPRRLLAELVHELRDARRRSPALTSRQREILALIRAGCGDHEISSRLFLSEETVRWHVRRLLRALGVRNRMEASAAAWLLPPPEEVRVVPSPEIRPILVVKNHLA